MEFLHHCEIVIPNSVYRIWPYATTKVGLGLRLLALSYPSRVLVDSLETATFKKYQFIFKRKPNNMCYLTVSSKWFPLLPVS
jgi:hypothetical protein